MSDLFGNGAAEEDEPLVVKTAKPYAWGAMEDEQSDKGYPRIYTPGKDWAMLDDEGRVHFQLVFGEDPNEYIEVCFSTTGEGDDVSSNGVAILESFDSEVRRLIHRAINETLLATFTKKEVERLEEQFKETKDE